MVESAPQQPKQGRHPALYIQLAATAVGFLVSTYFVSTILFNIGGPEQTMSVGFRWAVVGVALAFTLTTIAALVISSSRGFHAHRIEGDLLLLFRREGEVPLERLELARIESCEVESGDGELLARAEGYTDSPVSDDHGLIVIRARGRTFKLHTASTAQARELEQAIAAVRSDSRSRVAE